MDSKRNIAVVGLWHLGEVFSTGLAELGQNVVGIDASTETVKNLNNGILPLDEPGLSQLLKKNIAAKRLSFSHNWADAANCEIVWITQDTPVNDQDEADVSSVQETLANVLPHLKNDILLVFSSQLPVGTCQKFKELVKSRRPDLVFDIAYVPENLQLGRAVRSFFEPARVVVGAENDQVFSKIESIFAPLKPAFLKMNLASAEMSKHALNAFLATSLTFIYDIADLCERVGADVTDVSKAIRSDPRIGPAAYLDASIGFSGGTLGRDLKSMLARAEKLGLDLPVIGNVLKKNTLRKGMVAERLEEILGGLNRKKIGIWGVTYKAGTSTLRRSLALEVAQELTDRGAWVCASDPGALEDEVHKAGIKNFVRDYNQMAQGCQAVVLMTAWPEFKDMNMETLSGLMASPKVFFDTRNFLGDRVSQFKSSGLRYLGVGRGEYVN